MSRARRARPDEADGRGPAPRARRPRAFRPLVVIGFAVAAALACDVMLWWTAGRVAAAPPTPAWWPIQYNITFLDAETRQPVPGVAVGPDLVTRAINHPGPTSWTVADALGRWSHTDYVAVSLRVLPGSNQFEGVIVYATDVFFAVRAPGYRAHTIWPWHRFAATPRWVKLGPNQVIVRNATVLLHPDAPLPPAGTSP
jgi:hypothetical protein